MSQMPVTNAYLWRSTSANRQPIQVHPAMRKTIKTFLKPNLHSAVELMSASLSPLDPENYESRDWLKQQARLVQECSHII